MNEGSYNNVIRSNSPFSPMSPSTPSNYKANVNRTKTRKWVEAKAQSYDGDDWGNEFEEDDEYDEPEQEPPPRVAALRQQANPVQQPRTFSQPSTVVNSNKTVLSDMRSPSNPPLHIQTGVDPRSRLVGATLPAQNQSRFPPRESSVGHQEVSGPSDIGVSGSNPRSGSGPSAQSWTAQRAASPTKSSNFARPADIYNRMGEEREKARRSTEPGRLDLEGGHGRTDGATNTARANPSRLSTSPKLPDLARMSGFGDNFFSPPGGYGSSTRSSLSPTPDSHQTGVVGSEPGSLTGSSDGRRGTIGVSEKQHPSSILGGPKLSPNPKIIMPPPDDDWEPKKEDVPDTSQQPAPPRPQLPGTWVSESVSAGSENPIAVEKAEGLEPASLGSITNTDLSPMSKRHAEPADLEPTTTVKQLPSTNGSAEATAKEKAAYKPEDSFNNPTGKHDDAVASKVIAAGPGHHPTRQSLPPLQTDNPLVPSNVTRKDEQEAPRENDMAPPSSSYKDSPSQLPSGQLSAATTGPSFAPTAPLNPRRSILAPADFTTPGAQERKSTMSTVDTASPEKESDKLREEIFKSLSASPATAPGTNAILGSSNVDFDPAQGGLTRESTYLSGVYDDYLAPAEEKSLQETGQILKQGPNVTSQGTEDTSGPNLEKETSFPSIAPLSPHRNPEQETTRLPRRFSWEGDPERNMDGRGQVKPGPSTPLYDVDRSDGNTNESTTAAISSSLQAQPEESQVTEGRPSTMAEPLSPASLTSEKSLRSPTTNLETSRLSLVDEKEKVLIQSSPDITTEHPALANSIELTPAPSPPTQPASTAQPVSQAKVMAFRDILNIASIEHRIQKFDETRTQFYSMESGLMNWIAYMKSQPEHGNVTLPVGGHPELAQGQIPQSSVQSSSQQPYYQQYLNASNPSVQPAHPGRTPSGNIQHMFTGQPMSSFGSGNQVGTKSKELLQAAGAFGNKGMKSGMKLFNKGKNKLRGTGDKVFF